MTPTQLPLDQITPYEHNTRTRHNIAALAASIRAFGFLQPIVVDSTNTIIVGHGRYEAARHLGLPTVPVIVADNLTPEQIRAYRIADNITQELSDWHVGNLTTELAQLSAADIDLANLLNLPSLPIEHLLEPTTPPTPKPISPKPPPQLAWALICIPIDQFHQLQTHLDQLTQLPNCHAYTTTTHQPRCRGTKNGTTQPSPPNSPSDAITSAATTPKHPLTS